MPFFLNHDVISVFRCRARSNSGFGVLRVFFTKPCSNTICSSTTAKMMRAIRPLPIDERISSRPARQIPQSQCRIRSSGDLLHPSYTTTPLQACCRSRMRKTQPGVSSDPLLYLIRYNVLFIVHICQPDIGCIGRLRNQGVSRDIALDIATQARLKARLFIDKWQLN